MVKTRLTYAEVKAHVSERLFTDDEYDITSGTHGTLVQSVSYLDYILPSPISVNADWIIHKLVKKTHDSRLGSVLFSFRSACSTSSTGSKVEVKSPPSLSFPVSAVRTSSWTPARFPSGPILTLAGGAATRRLNTEPNHSSALSAWLSRAIMPASISTRLDEQEFLELADCYYVTSRPDYRPSRSGSTTTTSTNNTHLRRRDTTSGPRWRPSTLIESGDSGRASSKVDGLHQSDIVEGQTFSHIVIDHRGLPTTSTSVSLGSYSEDDMQTFRTTKEHDLGNPQNQMAQIDSTVQASSSIRSKISRPISTASLASGSCFGIIWFPRLSMKRLGFRLKKQQKFQDTRSINRGIGENSGSDHAFSVDSSSPGEEYFVPLPSRGLASASSPLLDLDYDYDLAVEVLINGSPKSTTPRLVETSN